MISKAINVGLFNNITNTDPNISSLLSLFLDFLFLFASSLHSFSPSRFYFLIHFLLHVFVLLQLLLTFPFSLSIAVNYQWILSVIFLNASYQVWYVRPTWPSFLLNTDFFLSCLCLSLLPFCRIFFLFDILFLIFLSSFFSLSFFHLSFYSLLSSCGYNFSEMNIFKVFRLKIFNRLQTH